MSLGVWPYIGSWGYSGVDEGNGCLTEIYPDNTLRLYQLGSTVKSRNSFTFVFKRCSKTKLAAMRAFYAANIYNKFYIYDPSVGITDLTFDPTGTSTLGRHTAVFFQLDAANAGSGDPALSWTSVGKSCVFDVSVTVTLLD
jgi:hypothetical protein